MDGGANGSRLPLLFSISNAATRLSNHVIAKTIQGSDTLRHTLIKDGATPVHHIESRSHFAFLQSSIPPRWTQNFLGLKSLTLAFNRSALSTSCHWLGSRSLYWDIQMMVLSDGFGSCWILNISPPSIHLVRATRPPCLLAISL